MTQDDETKELALIAAKKATEMEAELANTAKLAALETVR